MGKFKEFFDKHHEVIIGVVATIFVGIITTVLGIYYTWHTSSEFHKKSFEDYQKKVATATLNNITLELNTCDRIIRTLYEKMDKNNNKNEDLNNESAEYFDNVKNQILILKDIINNSKTQWSIIFPEEAKKVNELDRNLLATIAQIRTLDSKLEDLKQESRIKDIKDIKAELEKTLNAYSQQLKAYTTLKVYPSSVVSADAVVSGDTVLPNGNVFIPNQFKGKYEGLLPIEKIEK